MKKFVISAPSHFPASGGLTILHKLCHVLNTLGYDAYLAPSAPSGLGHWPAEVSYNTPYQNVKFITQELYENLEDAVVIYGQTWYGNYLNAPNVVRWIMGEVDPRYMGEWKDSDIWFWYSPLYKTKMFSTFDKNLDNDLFLPEFHTDIFTNLGLERTINCWTLRKAGMKGDFTKKVLPKNYIHAESDVFLGNLPPYFDDYRFPGDYVAFSKLLNITNRFYSYDTYTFLSIQAVMCGADSIVVPIDGLDTQTYFGGHELHKYNAYGLNDLPRAQSVRNELPQHINEINANSIRQIHAFVEKCNQYFK